MRPKEKMNAAGINGWRQLPSIGPVVGEGVVGEKNRFETLKIESQPMRRVRLGID